MPPAERPPVLVWRRGEALLAAEVDAVLEIGPVLDGVRVATREGDARILNLPGLSREPARRAVVVRCGDALAALPADGIEGVRSIAVDRFAATPSWLESLAPDHVRAIVTLDDDRLAALLALNALRPFP